MTSCVWYIFGQSIKRCLGKCCNTFVTIYFQNHFFSLRAFSLILPYEIKYILKTQIVIPAEANEKMHKHVK